MPAHVRYEVAGQVATITLDRPEKLNAMDRQMFTDLEAAAARAGGDPAVRAVVVTGAGRAFSSGLDVAEFAAMGDPAAARPGSAGAECPNLALPAVVEGVVPG